MSVRPKKAFAKPLGLGLTGDQLHHLLHGWMLDNQFHPFYHQNKDLQFPFKDETHRRELYFKNKRFLFSCAGEKIPGIFAKLELGEKPAAYFDYEAPQERETKYRKELKKNKLG